MPIGSSSRATRAASSSTVRFASRRLPRGSPHRLDLEAQVHDLLRIHEADWLGPLLGAIGNWEWRTGLLDWVTVAADVFLANAERWLPVLPLLGVHLRKARPHAADLARCEQLAYLNGLYLGDNDLTDDDLDALLRSPHLKRVRSLYLQSNNLSTHGICRFWPQTPHLPQLRVLCLGHNRIESAGWASLASSPYLKRLRALHLTLTSLREDGSASVGRLAVAIPSSRSDSRHESVAARLSGRAACTHAGFMGLRNLGYEMNRADDADIAALAGSPHAVELLHLSLALYQNFGDAALKRIGLQSLPGPTANVEYRLRFLGSGWGSSMGRSRTFDLVAVTGTPARRRAGQEIPQVLLGQPLLRRLRHLAPHVNSIGKEGLAALASHPRPLRLLELDLSLSAEMVADWDALLAKQALGSLTALKLTDPAPGSLAAMLPPERLPELRRLTLRGVPDLEDFQALLDNPLFGRLHDLRIDLAFETEGQQGPEVLRRLLAVWGTPSLRRLGLLWSLSAQGSPLAGRRFPPPRRCRSWSWVRSA